MFHSSLPDSTSRSTCETLEMHIGTVIMQYNVKKRKIPDKIGLASQMSKVRIQLIIDQESGN